MYSFSPSDFFHEARSAYLSAKKSKYSYQGVLRSRSRVISGEIEDLMANLIAVNVGKPENTYILDIAIRYGGKAVLRPNSAPPWRIEGAAKLNTDIAVLSPWKDNQAILTHLVDVKCSHGWAKTVLRDSLKNTENKMRLLAGKTIEVSVRVFTKKVYISEQVHLTMAFLSSKNQNKDLLSIMEDYEDNEFIRVVALSHGEHPDSDKLDANPDLLEINFEAFNEIIQNIKEGSTGGKLITNPSH
ncbi:hypothetical protein [Vibrio jasicida]|uniref:hypothetical protein n=1 Tax=Vibrio jasicida TaxID=766224 RepID=UPI000CE4BC7C|nr:hypothetical protein [Vibrio jasicida]